eukprot:TCONS_00044059-protein
MEKLKQTKATNHVEPLEFKMFSEHKLCAVIHLKEYINRVETLAPNAKQLFVSFAKPHKPVSKDTISRWCKEVLRLSGIDISKYTTHSSRSAATSKASKKGIPLKTIINKAGWKNERMFATTYQRTIECDFDIVT